MEAPSAVDREAQKIRAARSAVREVRDGMTVGLGTGSTAGFVIQQIGERVRTGLRIIGIPTSIATAALAKVAGITTRDFGDLEVIDLAIDGIDAIDPQLRAIKGRGGAMLREKIVATAAVRMIVVGDASKSVATLAATLLPVEVLPFSLAFVAKTLGSLGVHAVLRLRGDGTPWFTDQRNVVVDCDISGCADVAAINAALVAIPGVLGHGLFLSEIDALYLGLPEGTVVYRERPQREQ